MVHAHGIFYGTVSEILRTIEKIEKNDASQCQIRIMLPVDVTTKSGNIHYLMSLFPSTHPTVESKLLNGVHWKMIKQFMGYDDIKIERKQVQESPNFILLGLKLDAARCNKCNNGDHTVPFGLGKWRCETCGNTGEDFQENL